MAKNVYCAYQRRAGPAKVFKLKRDAIAWGCSYFDGVFIVLPIDKAKLSAKLIDLKKRLDLEPVMA
jgi:hypothetical protein